LNHVTTDWILILDADERMSETEWASLSALMENRDAMAYQFQVKNYHSATDLSSYDLMESYRLFRNGYGIRYEGAVHNQLAPSIERACILNQMSPASSALVIEHYGYALSQEAMQAKHYRIYAMVKNQLVQNGTDPYYLFHLVNICLAMGRFEEARKAVSILHMPSLRPELRVQAYYKSAQVALHYDDNNTATHYLHQALKIAPEAAFLYYLRSNVFYQMHRFSEGLRDAYRALDLVGYEEESGSLIHLPPDECFSNIGVGYKLSGDHISA
jgi:tetratricopeptide (TPR) repeat protein